MIESNRYELLDVLLDFRKKGSKDPLNHSWQHHPINTEIADTIVFIIRVSPENVMIGKQITAAIIMKKMPLYHFLLIFLSLGNKNVTNIM